MTIDEDGAVYAKYCYGYNFHRNTHTFEYIDVSNNTYMLSSERELYRNEQCLVTYIERNSRTELDEKIPIFMYTDLEKSSIPSDVLAILLLQSF